jgi:hypothetical protein
MTWQVLLDAAEAVRATLADTATADDRLADAPIAGIGWATVDLERAKRELDGLIAGDPDGPWLAPWLPMDRDAGLGARAAQRTQVEAAGPTFGPALVALEPDTEGALAAFLVRFGEGVGVIYLGAGPLRAGRLLRGRSAWGPHVIVLDEPSP